MKLLELLRSDDRAVSPVLGVALLIAMTVILAGVVGYVALGVDAKDANAPQANLDFTQRTISGSGETVAMSHDGGDALPAGTIDVKITSGAGTTYTLADSDPTAKITTGETVDVATGGEEGDVVKVVWQDPSSDREVLIAEYTVEAP